MALDAADFTIDTEVDLNSCSLAGADLREPNAGPAAGVVRWPDPMKCGNARR